jgi:hypothetical protein
MLLAPAIVSPIMPNPPRLCLAARPTRSRSRCRRSGCATRLSESPPASQFIGQAALLRFGVGRKAQRRWLHNQILVAGRRTVGRRGIAAASLPLDGRVIRGLRHRSNFAIFGVVKVAGRRTDQSAYTSK